MIRAEEHGRYGKDVKPWTEKELDDYYCGHGFGLMQRSDVIFGGVPRREQLQAMLANATGTDVPLHWLRELSKARDMLDEAEQLPHGSERLIELIDSAADIEDQAIKSFLS